MQRENNLEDLRREIEKEIEWLLTTEEDEIECISIETLEGILTNFFGQKFKI